MELKYKALHNSLYQLHQNDYYILLYFTISIHDFYLKFQILFNFNLHEYLLLDYKTKIFILDYLYYLIINLISDSNY